MQDRKKPIPDADGKKPADSDRVSAGGELSAGGRFGSAVCVAYEDCGGIKERRCGKRPQRNYRAGTSVL